MRNLRKRWTTMFLKEDGTAVVELGVLLPIYVVICFAILYLGYTTLIIQEGAELGHYASMAKDDQGSSVEGTFYGAGYEGEWELTDEEKTEDVFFGEDPTSGNDEYDIHDILTELSYTFWGGFTLQDGKLVYETTGGKNWRGSRIDKWEMMEENDETAWMLNGWVARSFAEVNYTYTPYFLGAVNSTNLMQDPDDPDFVEWNELELKTNNRTMIRGERERPFSDNLSGENIYELTDRFVDGESHRLPGYSDFGASDPHWTRK